MKQPLLIALLIGAPTFAASAQTASDSLRLSDLRATALNHDPRAAELELLASQSALRIRNINADLKPTLSVEGLAQYQSDVATIPTSVPGITLPTPSHDTYDA